MSARCRHCRQPITSSTFRIERTAGRPDRDYCSLACLARDLLDEAGGAE